ncbi:MULTISPECIES: LysR substrate-binding domain-containing protein [Paraburkholderia]|uniref:LysR substrate-binding domain-containing protein n=1 Tax=Paraburkholderia TaxID=1822464 RepID=UPI00179EC4FB|nr:LysR substrate-binding domain-containing protein [Paraburkholderia tropica]MBB2999256.1 DNA-binding transcriptional LysR family regulator [Paraburkholderia tropica]MBB6318844.1 DNA-binding transcriptional LysR family regulator [Paraburkholderia tropica]
MKHIPKARPPLANLETVCLVAQAGSFSAAATASGVTHGAISRRVAAVENWLGVRLFERHGRGIELTPDGQRFVGQVLQAFDIIDVAADQWRTRAVARLVRVSVVSSFAQLWLFDRLAQLEAGANPLKIQLDVGSRHVDIAGGEADLAIRYGRGNWPGLHAELLLPETLTPVAHPDIAAKIKANDPNGLLAHPLLHDSDLTGWRAWFDGHNVSLKRRQHDRRFEDYTLVLSAAEAGLGIALARLPIAATRLHGSQLVRLDRRTVANPLANYIVTSKQERRPEILELIQRLKDSIDENDPPIQRKRLARS